MNTLRLYLLLLFAAIGCQSFGQEGLAEETKWVTEQPHPEVYLRYEVKTNDTGTKHGAYKCRWRGKDQVKGYYFNNQMQGTWEHFYPNGKTRVKGNYLNGKKHGLWEFFYQDGTPQATIHYLADKPTYNWRGYHPNGRPAYSINYKLDSATKVSQFFYPNTKLAIDQVITETDSTKTVKTKKYYDSGILYESATKVNDLWHGRVKRYHYNSVPWEELYYHYGQLMEIRFCRNNEREELDKGTIRNGDGEAIRYHSDGTRYSQLHYRNGFPDGKALYFRYEKTRVKGFYRIGKPAGRWQFYNRYYKLFQERDYFDGSGLVYQRIYTGSGQEGWDGEFLNGYKDGMWTSYNFYGEVEEKTSYKLGFKHGIYRKLEGKVKRAEGGYFYGEKVGEWHYFNSNQKLTYKETFLKDVSFDSTSLEPTEMAVQWTQVSDFKYNYGNIPASFPGGMTAEKRFLETLLSMPEAGQNKEVSGTVILRATVTELGEIGSIKLIRGIGFGCDEAAIEAVRAMPYWSPEFQNGLPVEVVVEITVRFGEDL